MVQLCLKLKKKEFLKTLEDYFLTSKVLKTNPKFKHVRRTQDILAF